MRRHYVYYRVAERDLAPTLAAARAGLATLCAAWPGLRVELLRRPGSQDGLVTVMEVFDAGAAGIDADAAARIEAAMDAQVGCWVRGTLHVETFDLLAP